MRVIIQHNLGGPAVLTTLVDASESRPLPGEVFVRVKAIGLCNDHPAPRTS